MDRFAAPTGIGNRPCPAADRRCASPATSRTAVLSSQVPRFEGSHRLLGDLALDEGQVDAAIGAFSTAVDLTQGSVEALAALARGYAHAGDARGFDDTMRRIAARPYISPYTVATIRAAQADVDAAVALLDAAFEQGVAALPYVAIDPRLDRLRSDPRFGELLRRIG